MKANHYKLTADEQATTYEFLCEGPKGKIQKIVQFTYCRGGIYNLGFGDKDANGDIDDQVVTDNGDRDKVLNTVKQALYDFTDKYPNAKVYATGSTPARTRLYQIGINTHYDIASSDFEITGETEQGREPYQKRKNYRAFIVQRKNVYI